MTISSGSVVKLPLFAKAKKIRTKYDFGVIRSDIFYIIDGSIDMGDTSIEVPAGGFYYGGHNINISRLYSSEPDFTLFVSSVGGSGDVFGGKVSIELTGINSQVYDLTDSDGSHAVEVNTVNFNNCSSLGNLTNYRQGLEVGSGRFGSTPTLTLSGTWVGGYRINTSLVRSLEPSMTDPLFKAGVGFTMNGRFLTDINCDLPVNASFADFTPSNFTQPSLLQMRGATFSRNGQILSGDNNYFPNLDPEDLACSWYDNTGLRNTFEGGRCTVTTQAATSVPVVSTFYDIGSTFTASDLQHFSSPSNGALQNDGVNPIEFLLISSLTISGTSNDNISVKIVKWNHNTSMFEDVFIQESIINPLSGPRDAAFVTLYYNVNLEKDDYVKLQVANNTGTGSLTVEDGSFYQLNRQ